MQMHILGIGITKNTYQLHGVDPSGKAVTREHLPRHKLAVFIAHLPVYTIVMECCGGANYRARAFQNGHTVKLISPHFVKPFLSKQRLWTC